MHELNFCFRSFWPSAGPDRSMACERTSRAMRKRLRGAGVLLCPLRCTACRAPQRTRACACYSAAALPCDFPTTRLVPK